MNYLRDEPAHATNRKASGSFFYPLNACNLKATPVKFHTLTHDKE
jgi:hypothetical protein